MEESTPSLLAPAALKPGGQRRAPLYEALIEYQRRGVAPLHTPGHKGVAAPPELARFLTPLGLACDLPSLDDTDNSFHPRGCIAEAQRLAAELYGAAETFYLVNGSTQGVAAMVLAALAPGEKVLLPRYFHLSAFSALVLGGAVPVYLPTGWLEAAGPIPPAAPEVEEQLDLHPDARAVLITHPTYYGVGRPLAPLAALCRRRGVALLVDEAHGAHLHFLPPGGLRSALDEGADVVVQSVHKTLGSLVGTAQLHRAAGGRISAERLQAALNLLQSTSANYLLLASLDLARRWMARSGRQRFAHAVERAAALREKLQGIAGVAPLGVDAHPELAGCQCDPLRLVVDVAGLGLSGFAVEQRLWREERVLDEFADRRNLALVLGPGDPPAAYARLEEGLRRLSAERAATGRPAAMAMATDVAAKGSAPRPPMALTPREAAFRATARVPLRAALGRVCGEMITVYPPGLPLVCPGEEITAELLERCAELAAEPLCLFAEDPSLATIRVLAEGGREGSMPRRRSAP